MITVNFCRAPSHYWVGWCVYENGTYYASGITLDKMLYLIKRSLWSKKKISVRGVILASKQSAPEDAPLDLFSKTFKTKYWYARNEFGDFVVPKQEEETVGEPVAKPLPEPKAEPEYDYYDTEYQGDTLIVYGIMKKKVAEYKLGRPPFVPPVAPKIDPTPFQQPIVRYDTTNGDSYTDAQKAAAKWKPRADIPTE